MSKNADQWQNHISALLPDHAGGIKRGLVRQDPAGTAHDDERYLQFPSVTSFGLLAMLTRFAWSGSTQKGALSSESAKAAASHMIDALLLVLRGDAFPMFLLLDENYTPQWPADPVGTNPVCWTVDQDLMMHICTDEMQFLPHPSNPTALFREHLDIDISKPIHLGVFLQKLTAWFPRKRQRRNALLGQLLLRVAERFEHNIFRAWVAKKRWKA